MPFPLFEAPTADASGFEREGDCACCDARGIPVFRPDGGPACYACLRAGRAPWTKGTEFGMVDAEHAAQGLTQGTPFPPETGFELVPHPVDPSFPDDKWFSVKIAREHLEELLRTPKYSTWQGEHWRFCCRRPAVFLGAWDVERWERVAQERGRAVKALLREVMECDDALLDHLREALVRGSESTVSYVFRCADCGRLLGHGDMD